MNLLDRYIARQYLVNILALLVILACFVVTIDLSLNLGRYWKVAGQAAGSLGESGGARRALLTLWIVGDLWWPRLLSLFNFMLGLVLVGAMGFTCTQLVRHRELVALLSSGQSLFRVARPILIVALALTLVQALNQELVIPRIAPLLARDHGDVAGRRPTASRIPLAVDARGRLFYAAAFDPERGGGVLEDLYVWERDEQGKATRRIHAAGATWRDGAWDLESPTVEARSQEVSPGEAPTRLATDLDPTVLRIRRTAGLGQNLSVAQTREILSRLGDSGLRSDQARRQHDQLVRSSVGRFSTMLSNLLALCIAMSFFLTRAPMNMALQALKCAPVGIVALVGGVLGTALTIPRVPPAVSVFLPVLVLVPVAIAMVSRVRT